MQLDFYCVWIDYIVCCGMVVVYLCYQLDLKMFNVDFFDNVVGVFGDVFRCLQVGELGVCLWLNQVVYFGYFVGGLFVVNLVVVSECLKLLVVKVLMVVEFGKSQGKCWDGVVQECLLGLVKGILLLVVCGDEDSYVVCIDVKCIYCQSWYILFSDKNLLLLCSDCYGVLLLLVNYVVFIVLVFGLQYLKEEDSDWLFDCVEKCFEVQQVEGCYIGYDLLVIDVFDWYGIWKLFDGFIDVVFYNCNCQYVLGVMLEQIGMGQWSDGILVKLIKVFKQVWIMFVVNQVQCFICYVNRYYVYLCICC